MSGADARRDDTREASGDQSKPSVPLRPERIAIVGSRDFGSLELVDAFIDSLPANTIVITGGARGVDQRAETAARARGMTVEVFPADWERHGLSAGFHRNAQMVERADKVVAFWDGRSRGTKHSMDLASKAGKFDKLFADTRTPQQRKG